MSLAVSRSAPRPKLSWIEDEFNIATPVVRRCCRTARPLAVTRPSLLHISTQPSLPDSSMHQLDPDGYPTRALYYLHRAMLALAFHQAPASIPPPLFVHGANYDEDEAKDEEERRIAYEDQDLHDICATLVSTDYIVPPTPPEGASPCDTPPPRYTLPARKHSHDERACRIARLLVWDGAIDVEGCRIEELEMELSHGAGWISPVCGKRWACPNAVTKEEEEDKEHVLGRNLKSLLEEVYTGGCSTPSVKKRDRAVRTKQVRKKAKNTLNEALNETRGTQELVA
ncbi:hypothetical protein CTheo_1409 [Ceratobasidium theobromae]|uniref:Uncharacterized protein n=1 Tax=Ceratobasidium theobromae TaxID=1582974 RepID=A0A5N5QU70_9AGAM|nr:hypothetical protein CTheo_1409 [Ceratobasidium theobromae]